MVNYIDIGILIVLAFFTIKGLFRGLIAEVMGLAGVFVGLMLATKYMSNATELIDEYIDVPAALTSLLGFVLIFLLVQFAVQIIIHLADNLNDIPLIGMMMKLMGGIVGFLKGGLIVSLIILMLSYLPVGKSIIPKQEDSKLLPYARDFVPIVFNYATKLIPESKTFYGELKESLQTMPTKPRSAHIEAFMNSIADEVSALPQSTQSQ